MKKIRIILKSIYIISLVFFLILTFNIYKNNILPTKYKIIFTIAALLFYIVIAFIIFKVKPKKIATIFLILFLFFTSAFLVLGNSYIDRSIKTLNQINDSQAKEDTEFSLIVLKESSIKTINDVLEKNIYLPENQDVEKIKIYQKEFKNKFNKDFVSVQSSDYLTNVGKLLTGEYEIILFNENFRSIVEEAYPDFAEKTRVIEPIVLSEIVKDDIETDKKIVSGDSFNLYVSGIDTYGSITSVSRSDVNIILTVNPNKNKILITTIPRDSYVKIAGAGNNQYDKLTHSGVYGITSSIKTLENLFDIDIDYYARVNFSSVVEIVDILGGINVNNDKEFTAVGKYHFNQGMVHLNGEEALAFSRERYSLNEGDLDRGRHQMKVIEGIINKAISPAILLNYNSLLDLALKYVDTNVASEKIIDLVNNQLDNPNPWSIESQEVKGSGKMGLSSYAMPGWDLYMYELDENSIKDVKNQIDSVMKN